MSTWKSYVIIAVLVIVCYFYGAHINAQTECLEFCDDSILSVEPPVLSPGGLILRLETSNPIINIGLFNTTDDFCSSNDLEDAYLCDRIYNNSASDMFISEFECRAEMKSLKNGIVIVIISMNEEDQDTSGTTLDLCYAYQEIYWKQNGKLVYIVKSILTSSL